ncbi:unnamed protein product [Prunus armeniaca]
MKPARDAINIIFKKWDIGAFQVEDDARHYIENLLEEINAQVIEDPSMVGSSKGKEVRAGKVFVNSIISAEDLEVEPEEK